MPHYWSRNPSTTINVPTDFRITLPFTYFWNSEYWSSVRTPSIMYFLILEDIRRLGTWPTCSKKELSFLVWPRSLLSNPNHATVSLTEAQVWCITLRLSEILLCFSLFSYCNVVEESFYVSCVPFLLFHKGRVQTTDTPVWLSSGWSRKTYKGLDLSHLRHFLRQLMILLYYFGLRVYRSLVLLPVIILYIFLCKRT